MVFVELTDARVWSTDVYESLYFNEYVKSAISKDTRKTIIVNGMTGSSWRFNRFDHFSIIVSSDKILAQIR